MQRKTGWILPLIVLAQCTCTSVWFAGNAVLPGLMQAYRMPEGAPGHVTAVVQLGFITGTLLFALLRLADRWPPAVLFWVNALAAAAANYAITLPGQGITGLMACRFLTGLFLAGIYPVGMKIAADHYREGLGKALGYLVGALVLGTALPHLLKAAGTDLPWKAILRTTSGLSAAGGFLMLLIPPGPYAARGSGLERAVWTRIWKDRDFRSSASGYFGHMWELYAFWAFVPLILTTYEQKHPAPGYNIPLCSFFIIGAGSLACIGSGYLSLRYGPRNIAFGALLMSGCCCLLSPLAFRLPPGPFLAFLVFWGLTVIADSPMFSTLVARHAPAAGKGTALTLVTSIGFAITIGSIELISALHLQMDQRLVYLFLAIGPLLGILAMSRNRPRKQQ